MRGTVPHVTLNVPALVRGDVDPATARNVLGVAAASSVRQAAATLRVDLPEGTLNALAIEAACNLTGRQKSSVYDSISIVRAAVTEAGVLPLDLAGPLRDERGHGNHYGGTGNSCHGSRRWLTAYTTSSAT